MIKTDLLGEGDKMFLLCVILLDFCGCVGYNIFIMDNYTIKCTWVRMPKGGEPCEKVYSTFFNSLRDVRNTGDACRQVIGLHGRPSGGEGF